jgi:hypothetical protein
LTGYIALSTDWYKRITSNLDCLDPVVDAVIFFEAELEEAKKEVKIIGSFERQSSQLPGIMEHRFGQLQEIEAILKFLEIKREKAHTEAFKRFLENYNRALSSRDAERYANGDEAVLSLSLLINLISLIRNLYMGITKGLENKGYQLNNLAKLKVAGLEDYHIS